MSTSCVTIVRGYIPIIRRTEEVFRFFRMYDGYPSGHGLMMACALKDASRWLNGVTWAETILRNLLWKPDLAGTPAEEQGGFIAQFESQAYDDIDIDYLYVLDASLKDGADPEDEDGIALTISCYEAKHLRPGDTYAEVLAGNPVFSGTPDEYIEWQKNAA